MVKKNMRCTSYALADHFDLGAIAHIYSPQSWPSSYRDALHIPYKSGDVFLFSYGCLVFWNVSQIDELAFNETLRHGADSFIENPEYEEVNFQWGERMGIKGDVITLPTEESLLHQLALSYALGQEIKLSVFEARIEDTIRRTTHIPEALARDGRIPLPQKEISKMIGDLFLTRSYINLKSDILDVPDFFWEYTDLEPAYHKVAKYLNISQRTDVLNKRCMIIHELFQMLGEELNNRHSSLLEIIIIVLISIEIIVSVTHAFFL